MNTNDILILCLDSLKWCLLDAMNLFSLHCICFKLSSTAFDVIIMTTLNLVLNKSGNMPNQLLLTATAFCCHKLSLNWGSIYLQNSATVCTLTVPVPIL